MRIVIVFMLGSAISAAATFAAFRPTVCVPVATVEKPDLPIGPRQQVTGGQRF
jgi:hypothetical protein